MSEFYSGYEIFSYFMQTITMAGFSISHGHHIKRKLSFLCLSGCKFSAEKLDENRKI